MSVKYRERFSFFCVLLSKDMAFLLIVWCYSPLLLCQKQSVTYNTAFLSVYQSLIKINTAVYITRTYSVTVIFILVCSQTPVCYVNIVLGVTNVLYLSCSVDTLLSNRGGLFFGAENKRYVEESISKSMDGDHRFKIVTIEKKNACPFLQPFPLCLLLHSFS